MENLDLVYVTRTVFYATFDALEDGHEVWCIEGRIRLNDGWAE